MGQLADLVKFECPDHFQVRCGIATGHMPEQVSLQVLIEHHFSQFRASLSKSVLLRTHGGSLGKFHVDKSSLGKFHVEKFGGIKILPDHPGAGLIIFSG